MAMKVCCVLDESEECNKTQNRLWLSLCGFVVVEQEEVLA